MAALLLLTEQTPAMTQMITAAVASLEIDSINLWGGGNGDGDGLVSDLVRDLFKTAVPALSIAEHIDYKGPGFLGEMVAGTAAGRANADADAAEDNSSEGGPAEELFEAEDPEG